MKNAIIGATLILVICLISLTHMSITAKDIRKDELETSMNNAARITMEVVKEKGRYSFSTEEEMIEEFNNNLLSQITTESNLEIQVMGADVQNGFLDVQVINTFKYPTGAEGHVSARKTILFDEVQ